MKIESRIRWRILSIISSLLFIILLLNTLVPCIGGWKQVCNEITIKKKQVKISKNWQEELFKLENEKNRLEKKYKNISQSYTQLKNLSETINLLNKAAINADINIDDIRPGRREQFETYEQLALSLSMRGTFHNTGEFIKELESKQNPIFFHSFTMEYNKENELETILTLSIFTLKEEL